MEKQGISEEDMRRLMCERVLNESWSNVEQHKDEIEMILVRGKIDTNPKKADREISLLFMAASAFLQKVALTDADNVKLGLYNTVPCGRKYTSCSDCPLEECDYF